MTEPHPPVRFVPCEHPERTMRDSVLLDPDEARVCMACQSMVFADGHTEPIGITKITTSKR
jgi:hypothetical protein